MAVLNLGNARGPQGYSINFLGFFTGTDDPLFPTTISRNDVYSNKTDNKVYIAAGTTTVSWQVLFYGWRWIEQQSQIPTSAQMWDVFFLNDPTNLTWHRTTFLCTNSGGTATSTNPGTMWTPIAMSGQEWGLTNSFSLTNGTTLTLNPPRAATSTTTEISVGGFYLTEKLKLEGLLVDTTVPTSGAIAKQVKYLQTINSTNTSLFSVAASSSSSATEAQMDLTVNNYIASGTASNFTGITLSMKYASGNFTANLIARPFVGSTVSRQLITGYNTNTFAFNSSSGVLSLKDITTSSSSGGAEVGAIGGILKPASNAYTSLFADMSWKTRRLLPSAPNIVTLTGYYDVFYTHTAYVSKDLNESLVHSNLNLELKNLAVSYYGTVASSVAGRLYTFLNLADLHVYANQSYGASGTSDSFYDRGVPSSWVVTNQGVSRKVNTGGTGDTKVKRGLVEIPVENASFDRLFRETGEFAESNYWSMKRTPIGGAEWDSSKTIANFQASDASYMLFSDGILYVANPTRLYRVTRTSSGTTPFNAEVVKNTAGTDLSISTVAFSDKSPQHFAQLLNTVLFVGSTSELYLVDTSSDSGQGKLVTNNLGIIVVSVGGVGSVLGSGSYGVVGTFGSGVSGIAIVPSLFITSSISKIVYFFGAVSGFRPTGYYEHTDGYFYVVGYGTSGTTITVANVYKGLISELLSAISGDQVSLSDSSSGARRMGLWVTSKGLTFTNISQNTNGSDPQGYGSLNFSTFLTSGGTAIKDDLGNAIGTIFNVQELGVFGVLLFTSIGTYYTTDAVNYLNVGDVVDTSFRGGALFKDTMVRAVQFGDSSTGFSLAYSSPTKAKVLVKDSAFTMNFEDYIQLSPQIDFSGTVTVNTPPLPTGWT
jgi:hypothetical protein